MKHYDMMDDEKCSEIQESLYILKRLSDLVYWIAVIYFQYTCQFVYLSFMTYAVIVT